MIERNFFLLESRRFLSRWHGGCLLVLYAGLDAVAALAVSVLAASWGWQLVRVYRWFAHPEELAADWWRGRAQYSSRCLCVAQPATTECTRVAAVPALFERVSCLNEGCCADH